METASVNSVKGLYYFSDVVPSSLSDEVMNFVKSQNDWIVTPGIGKCMLQFGYKHDYINNCGHHESDDKLPVVLKKLRLIIENKCKEIGLDSKLDNCFINKYLRNKEIILHTDPSTLGPIIGCFSFYQIPSHGSNINITFDNNHSIHHQSVPHGSLYIMTNDSRYVWKHGLLTTSQNNPDDYMRISVGFSSRPPNGNRF